MVKSQILPPIYYLKECFSYDPETGLLTWKTRPPSHFKTMQRWRSWNTSNSGNQIITKVQGYLYAQISGHRIAAHRIAYAIYTGHWASGEIDHINGDRSDNRFINLRDVRRSDNRKNSAIGINNVSGVIGVHKHRITGKWVAQIKINKRVSHLGYFNDINDAIAVRKEAEISLGFHPNHGRCRGHNS